MIVALGIFVSAFVTTGFLSLRLSKAVEGYEDQDGFHLTTAGKCPLIKTGVFTTPSAAVKRVPRTQLPLPTLLSGHTSRVP